MGTRILSVEDDERIRTAVKLALEDEGWTVDEATDGDGAIAAFGRECTRRGVPPPTVTLFGSPFLTWRGLPLVPSDKLHLSGNKTDILLLRTGEKKRGVVGLFQPGLPGEVAPSLSVRLMGINQRGAASYLVSLYCSAAVLTDDALGVLENVEVDKYHEYR